MMLIKLIPNLKEIMIPPLKNVSKEYERVMISSIKKFYEPLVTVNFFVIFF